MQALPLNFAGFARLARWRGPLHTVPRQLLQSGLGRAGARLVRTSRHKTLMDFVASRDIDLVLDIGANEGQFGMALRHAGYQGRIISFEPLSQAYQKLQKAAEEFPPWETKPMGIGERDADAAIHVSSNTVFSSLKRLSREAEPIAETRTVREETVKLRRLDGVLQDIDLGRCLLKSDTQGYERNVLLGGEQVLARCCGVVIELPIRHLYDDVWTIEEALGFMRARGFIVSNFIPVEFLGVDLFEVDCVLCRAESL